MRQGPSRAMERLRVIKVKRRLGEDSLPDLLLLDHTVDLKRSRRITGIYERIADAEEDETVLVARIKPSTLETLSRLQVSSQEADEMDEEEASVDSEVLSTCEVQFDYYHLKEEAVPGSIDVTGLCRIVIAEEDLLLLDNSCSEDDLVCSDDDDSNAEDYYQNDYPDEDDDEYDSDEKDSDAHFRRWESDDDEYGYSAHAYGYDQDESDAEF